MHHVECGVALFGKLYPEHMDQQYPAQQAIDILAKVLPKRLMDWTLADFGPISDLPGRAVLALVIVNYTHAAHLGEMQRCLVAQRACSTHPAKLLQIIKDRRKALDFLQVTLPLHFLCLLNNTSAHLGCQTWLLTTAYTAESETLNSHVGINSRLFYPSVLLFLRPWHW